MRKIFIAILLALSVASCAGLPSGGAIVNSQYNPITRERLYAAEANYKVAQNAAYAYRSLRQCRKSEVVSFTNICRRYSTTLAIQAASRKVNAAFVVARKCMRDTPDTVDCVAGVENAISDFRNQIANATGGAR